MSKKSYRYIYILLQITTVAVFIGRAWQHLIWDAPFRTLLWDEGLMKGLVEGLFNIPWDVYITSPQTDLWIERIIKAFGVFYVICALIAAIPSKLPSSLQKLLPVGSLLLIFLAALYTKEKFFAIGQFFEYSIQFTSPFLFYLLLQKRQISHRFIWAVRILVALTFSCHGLYAVNFYPRPGLFVEMTINILGVGEEGAIYFLNIAGILDFVVSAAVLIFPSRWLKPFLIYAFLWGLATTLARIWANIYWDFMGESLVLWLHESVYRIGHFLLVGILYVYYFFDSELTVEKKAEVL